MASRNRYTTGISRGIWQRQYLSHHCHFLGRCHNRDVGAKWTPSGIRALYPRVAARIISTPSTGPSRPQRQRRSAGAQRQHSVNLPNLVTQPTDSAHLPLANKRMASADWRLTVAWVIGAALLRALLSAAAPLFPDETYYWLWTRRLEAGFFDHPPGVALLIAAGTAVFGDTVLGVRLGPAVAALLVHIAMAIAAWQLAGRGLTGARAARRSAMLLTVVPIVTLGLVIATPDALLFATSMTAIVSLDRALAAPVRSWVGFGWWTTVGLLLGAALVAKYSAILLPLGVMIAFLAHPALRARFRDPGPWWASLLAAGIFAPVLVWNYLHEWISFRFQLGHGFGAVAAGSAITRELELFGGQFALVTPILFALVLASSWRALADGWRTRLQHSATDLAARKFVLAVMSLVPLCFFGVSALRRSVEPNWPTLMYPTAMLLLAVDTHAAAVGVWWRRGVTLAAALLAIASVHVWHPIVPVAPRKDPIARAYGWDTLARAVDAARGDPFLDGTVDRWVATERYQEASELSFHVKDQLQLFSLNLAGRTNQFDLWETAYDKIRPGDGLVAVFDDEIRGEKLGMQVSHWFKEFKRGERVILRRANGEVAHRRIWLYRIARDVPPRQRALPTLSQK